MKIKNVIFDIGNVLVRWAPYEVIQAVFPEYVPKEFYQQIHPIWIDLNLGKLTEKEAIRIYQDQLGVAENRITYFMNELKVSQVPIPGSLELLKKLRSLKINLYAMTDNVKEIMEYHKIHSNFMDYFKDIIVSAEVGILKPDPKIYQHLLNKHNIDPFDSVFVDDLMANVESALSVKMHAFQFTDAKSCEEQLIKLGIKLK